MKKRYSQQFYAVQADAMKLFKLMAERKTCASEIGAEYGCSRETVLNALKSVVGTDLWEKHIFSGARPKRKNHTLGTDAMNASRQEKMDAQDVETKKEIAKLRETKWWECVACAWDTMEQSEFDPAEKPDKCPHCNCVRFEGRRELLALPRHFIRKGSHERNTT